MDSWPRPQFMNLSIWELHVGTFESIASVRTQRIIIIIYRPRLKSYSGYSHFRKKNRSRNWIKRRQKKVKLSKIGFLRRNMWKCRSLDLARRHDCVLLNRPIIYSDERLKISEYSYGTVTTTAQRQRYFSCLRCLRCTSLSPLNVAVKSVDWCLTNERAKILRTSQRLFLWAL